MIDPLDRLPRFGYQVLGLRMACVSVGTGRQLVFLHGNVSSSYLWRNVIRYLSAFGQCIAPDLLGMGETDGVTPSGPTTYGIAHQLMYLDALFDMIPLEKGVVFVGHELGATMALDWARRHPGVAAGICLIDGVIDQLDPTTWEPSLRELVTELRSDMGEQIALNENAILDRYLPRLTLRLLGPYEAERYRFRFQIPGESRRPLLSLLKELPFRGETGPLTKYFRDLKGWMTATPTPKLLIAGRPGHLIGSTDLERSRRWRNVQGVIVPGRHLLPEDAPTPITTALADWIKALGR